MRCTSTVRQSLELCHYSPATQGWQVSFLSGYARGFKIVLDSFVLDYLFNLYPELLYMFLEHLACYISLRIIYHDTLSLCQPYGQL